MIASAALPPRMSATLGVEAAAERLALAHSRDRLAHAYLLLGPAQVGKRRLALWLAQALLCHVPRAGFPCGDCRSCRLVAEEHHPDLLVAPSPLKVDATRRLLSDLSLLPVESARRVALLADFDQATLGAANSLLKTLEEPPSRATLILTAGQPELVLSTVRSRCQLVNVQAPGANVVAKALRELHGLSPEAALSLGRRSGGRLDWAFSEIEDPSREGQRLDGLLLLERLMAAPRSARLAAAADLARRPEALEGLLEGWIGWWRDALLWRLGLGDAAVNRERDEVIAPAAARLGEASVVSVISSMEDALRRLRANGSAQLILENLLLEMPS